MVDDIPPSMMPNLPPFPIFVEKGRDDKYEASRVD